MIRSQFPGKLIVLEGLDGAGTTTQAAFLATWLITQQNVNALMTAEPSRGPIGAMIRSVLTKRMTMDQLTLAGLYAADRLDHLYHEPDGIIHQLKQGKWIILDRYYLSSFAYQASQMTESQRNWLFSIHQPCLIPDLTLFLDVPVDVCLNRIAVNRNKQFELFEKKSMLRSVEKQYRNAITMFEALGERIIRINGTESIENVQAEMTRHIKEHLLV